MFFYRANLCAIVLVAAGVVPAFGAGLPPASIQSVRAIRGHDEALLEIVATRSLTPKLQSVEKPSRLVIDLPGAIFEKTREHIPFHDPQIKNIRVDQYRSAPAVTRIVVDLSSPVRYSWDVKGNRLTVHIRPDEAATAKPPTAPAAAPSAPPIAVPYASGASGTLVEAGSRVASGASITAKDQPAVLRLTRGGEVRVCPGTTVSLATSPGGEDLMLGMNTGAIETHYHIDESSDSILTPDFRIVLPGPGEFNLAVKSDASGNTCVSSLDGSNSSVVVAELIGNGTYEVKPNQQVLFRQGRMQSVETPLTTCGCPAPEVPVMQASPQPTNVVPENRTPTNLALANSKDAPSSTTGNSDADDKPIAQAPSGNSTEESKAQVSTPLVFNAKEFAKMRATPSPALSAKVAALPLSSKPADPLPPLVVLPPTPRPKHKGFFAKVGGFLHAVF